MEDVFEKIKILARLIADVLVYVIFLLLGANSIKFLWACLDYRWVFE